MSIQTYKEIYCDNCGGADHYNGSNKIANKLARDNGWIIKGKKHFCNNLCYNNYKINNTKASEWDR